jgi:phosphatidylserine decarboxylase
MLENSANPRWPNPALCVLGSWLRLAPEGVLISVLLASLAMALFFAGLSWLAWPLLVVAVGVASFFRDPARIAPDRAGVVVSAADGKITDICQGAPPGSAEMVQWRLSVFMSPLNVHVNRAPIAGEVTGVEHTAGEFLAAFRDQASERNERNAIVLRDLSGRSYTVVQIAGYLARRIVCRLRMHDKIAQGQRLGLIMFGSRVDHFFPLEYRLAVERGDRVKAGVSILGQLDSEQAQ